MAQIKSICGYTKTENLRQLHVRLFGNGPINWDEQKPAQDFLPLLQEIAKPKPNKDQGVVRAAQALLNSIDPAAGNGQPVALLPGEAQENTAIKIPAPVPGYPRKKPAPAPRKDTSLEELQDQAMAAVRDKVNQELQEAQVKMQYQETQVKELQERLRAAQEALDITVHGASIAQAAAQEELQALVQELEQLKAQVQAAGKKRWQLFPDFTELDLAFYINMGAGIYGTIYLLGPWGGVFGAVYFLLSRHLLRMTKNRHSNQTAASNQWLVWVLEGVTFFIHLVMFNLGIWQNPETLPFDIEQNPGGPFYIALGLSSLLSGGAIYAVLTSLALSNEKQRAAEYEKQTGLTW